MATHSGSTVQCYSERDIAVQTGMPGPFVADLVPRLPIPHGKYSTTAKVYGSDSIERARLANQMLRVGVRRHFVRAAIAQPMTADQLAAGLTEWTTLADNQFTSETTTTEPKSLSNRTLVALNLILTLALIVISALLLGVLAGLAFGMP